jgi:PAS domain S-box-containing protein
LIERPIYKSNGSLLGLGKTAWVISIVLVLLHALIWATGLDRSPYLAHLVPIMSVGLCAGITAYWSVRTAGFSRNFWLLMNVSFLILAVSQVFHLYESVPGAQTVSLTVPLSSLAFVGYIVPFCLTLLLHDSDDHSSIWAKVIDVSQLLLISALLTYGLYLLPQVWSDQEDISRILRLRALIYGIDYVLATVLFWGRTYVHRTSLESSVYRLCGLYLTVFTVITLISFQIQSDAWLFKTWTGMQAPVKFLIFFLLAAHWAQPTKSDLHESHNVQRFLAMFIVPGLMPLLVLTIALQYPSTVTDIAKGCVFLSIALAFGRFLLTAVDEFQALEAKNKTEKHFYTLSQNLPGVVYICKNDEKFTNIYLSDQIEELTGFAKVECLIKGGLSAILTDPTVLPRIRAEIDRAVSAQRPYQLSYRITHRNGDIRWVEEFGAGIYEGNRLQYLCGFLSDVTPRRKLEDHIRQVQKMDALGSLAGGVAHDFNNMLTAISGYAQLLEMKNEDSNKEEIAGILLATKRAATLTKRLLTFSRQQKLKTAPVHLNDLLLDLEPMMSRLVNTNYKLDLQLDDDLQRFPADSGQLEQVIINLVVNARDAMEKGGSINIVTMMVTVHDMDYNVIGLVPGSYVTLAVMDHGTGIDPKIKSKIFEPFFTTKPDGKGTGLGLSTVYGIVKQHNGQIEVETGPGGTSFQLYFPVQFNIEATEPLRQIEPV